MSHSSLNAGQGEAANCVHIPLARHLEIMNIQDDDDDDEGDDDNYPEVDDKEEFIIQCTWTRPAWPPP